MALQKTPKNDMAKQTLSFYWRRVRRYPKHLAGLAVSIPLTVLVNQFLPPLIVADVLNKLGKHEYQPHHLWASFGPELIAYIVIEIIGGTVFWRIVDLLVWSLEGRVERDLAQQVFGHLMKLSAAFHANTFGGSLVSQNNKLMGSYIRLADTTWFQLLPMVWSLLFAILILLPRAPWFVAALAAFAVFYVVTALFVTRPVRRLSTAHAAAETKQTGYLADMVTNVMAVKSFAGSRFETKTFGRITDHTNEQLRKLANGHQKQQAYFSGVAGLISGMSLVMAALAVVTFNADLATVFLILTYTATIVGQLFQFSNSALRTLNRAFGDATDMVRTMQLTPEILDPAKPEKVRISRGKIEFDNVTFKHDGADKPIFKDFVLRTTPGEKIGLVGHSGSGKTTLTRLLLRFSDIQEGEIRIDGQAISTITQDDLRRHIAYVPQEPLLFHRSISENISYGSEGASQESIEAVAKMAHAHEFIESLPEGYNTLVGERGVKLSGGQRQRVVIARAMLKNAPILLLDEATSALDSESEVLIQDALWKLMEGRTAIVIAHRLSTIQKMDRIVVLEEGRIAEQGSHKDLLRGNGTYAKLWAHQSGGFIEE